MLCYPSDLATESSLKNTALFLPTYSAYSHSAYNSLSALLKRAKSDFTIMFLPLSLAKDSTFLESDWAEFLVVSGQEFC